ncbi:Aliphatic sulfonates import ATP-binding protein SsuB [Pseudomonas coronafaciens pv. garcae]|uniref:Aliphatic sulfonates import ATP-binding protein SsuB n=4 Tax=Pseudomonas syringae group TaxID=136849 RepID=A0AB37QKE1_9PSED|nr:MULTISPECIES: ABC transporter ATP-binding protein [Pseudomonas syringae group]KGS13776.1 sulfonate ABC transporter ATP-binding protein [Pseudomonas coronafaciens]KPB49562.1 Aliphatic sulfonates import ATP-binding protein SsuB [Pseudomonas coronafaciens pv. oryzae]KPY06071.1 Aliphatic sulfonates import ATP-binding protein SsuB [Pseudomonas coronafaciens pv. oryzae]MCQ3014421.1 ABC transporter ATP-binding protein [Pseudomonas tremae]QGL57020.1 ATP-binding cassette domain-containing protein [P
MPDVLMDIRVERKAFAGDTVLRDIALSLRLGEVVSLLGPSGCGKSTLLRIVARLEQDFRGSVERVQGEVAFVFQEPRLMPWLTVEQNIGFSDDDSYDRAWVKQLIEEVGLSGFADALPKALSGGMAQRVALARGLYSHPAILLLDEPFSAVDAFTRMKLQDLLLQLARRHAIALLLVTHDVDEALYLSDRVLVMGNRPGTITHELLVEVPAPRDRRDPLLARLKAQALTGLHQAHVI